MSYQGYASTLRVNQLVSKRWPVVTRLEANICGASTQRLRSCCRPRSRGYRLVASSLSVRPSQQSYSEVDCDQGGEWPKTKSLHPSRWASASAYSQIINNARSTVLRLPTPLKIASLIFKNTRFEFQCFRLLKFSSAFFSRNPSLMEAWERVRGKRLAVARGRVLTHR